MTTRVIRTALVAVLTLAMAAPAFAQNAAADPQIGSVAPPQISGFNGSGKPMMWTGAGLFIGGMATAIYGFLDNSNGKYPQFGEATASNKVVGAAGISAAFAGGALMAIGHHVSKRYSPDIQIGNKSFSVGKSVSW